jgi:hypothetical protein
VARAASPFGKAREVREMGEVGQVRGVKERREMRDVKGSIMRKGERHEENRRGGK